MLWQLQLQSTRLSPWRLCSLFTYLPTYLVANNLQVFNISDGLEMISIKVSQAQVLDPTILDNVIQIVQTLQVVGVPIIPLPCRQSKTLR